MTTIAVRFRRRTLLQRLPGYGIASLIAIVVLALVAIIGPLFLDASTGSLSERLLPIGTPGHILGTDTQGRDMLARLVVGMRASLVTAVAPVILSFILGMAIGLLAGMGGRAVNAVFMRLLDISFAFPAVLLALLLATALGPGLATTIIALTLVWIPPLARIAETEVVRVREAEFIAVARVSGAHPARIAVSQVAPAILPMVLAYATSLVGASIAIVGGLGFVGLGVPSPQAELGSMISEMQTTIYSDPALAVLPVILTLVLAVLFPILGDALGKALAGRSLG